MFYMTGQIPHLQIFVFGEGSLVIMSPLALLHCEFCFPIPMFLLVNVIVNVNVSISSVFELLKI